MLKGHYAVTPSASKDFSKVCATEVYVESKKMQIKVEYFGHSNER